MRLGASAGTPLSERRCTMTNAPVDTLQGHSLSAGLASE